MSTCPKPSCLVAFCQEAWREAQDQPYRDDVSAQHCREGPGRAWVGSAWRLHTGRRAPTAPHVLLHALPFTPLPRQAYFEEQWARHRTWWRYLLEPTSLGVALLSLAPIWLWSVAVSLGVGLYCTFAEVRRGSLCWLGGKQKHSSAGAALAQGAAYAARRTCHPLVSLHPLCPNLDKCAAPGHAAHFQPRRPHGSLQPHLLCPLPPHALQNQLLLRALVGGPQLWGTGYITVRNLLRLVGSPLWAPAEQLPCGCSLLSLPLAQASTAWAACRQGAASPTPPAHSTAEHRLRGPRQPAPGAGPPPLDRGVPARTGGGAA